MGDRETTAQSQLEAFFGRLELRVLEALWSRPSEASVRDLQGGFPHVAYTTLMTTLDRLYRKGVLDRRRLGRAFVYRPRYSRDDLRSGLAGDAFRAILGPDAGAVRPLLSCFIEAVESRDGGLLDELERLVQARRAERRDER